jgi:very-short-patch-repair endonuclease
MGGMNRTITFAKQLRKNMTDAERKLWEFLRHKQISGLKFRKQAPIGKFIVDFVCHEAKIIIELDGGQHDEEKNINYDNERSLWLSSQGYFVQRYWNNEIFENIEGVVDSILDLCSSRICTPHPFLPPQSGGKGRTNEFRE